MGQELSRFDRSGRGPARVDHVVNQKARPFRDVPSDGEAAVEVSGLLTAVLHLLLWGCIVHLLQRSNEGQAKGGGQSLREGRHKLGMVPGWNAGDPFRGRGRSPLLYQPLASLHQGFIETAAVVFAPLDQLRPAGILKWLVFIFHSSKAILICELQVLIALPRIREQAFSGGLIS